MEGGTGVCLGATRMLEEVEAHDVEVLPHLYSEDDIDRLLPRLDAPAPGPNVEDWKPSEEEQGRDDGRLGNVSQVLGRHQGCASAAPSRQPSSAETVGDSATSRALGPGGTRPPGSSRR